MAVVVPATAAMVIPATAAVVIPAVVIPVEVVVRRWRRLSGDGGGSCPAMVTVVVRRRWLSGGIQL
ncbi:hypothetical protein AXX17_AT1G51320 [Arabidopsis thaliana]|uniref:Uncharacterized protein n=1 Tax=Arabidopsis thaliana TaxID=3702 RepID=A0A178W5C6_ARATH|nr:hypothetical protein AXX17_AT1G51320 [Arabidopsis thaliana]